MNVYGKTLAEIICGEKKMPEVLYHYTSPDAFVSIVGHKDGVRFMCTNYRCLNDDAEFIDGYKMALRWMKENGFEKGTFNRVYSAMQEMDTIECWLSTPWVLSLSASRDSTVHWMAYTDRSSGGFAIGVDSERLVECIHETDKMIKETCRADVSDMEKDIAEPIGGMFVAPCIYYNHQDCQKKGGVPSAFGKALKHIFSDKEKMWRFREKEPDLYASYCLRHVLRVSALLKRDDYDFEDEWRVVFVPMKKMDYLFSNIRIIGGKARVSLRRTLDKKCTREIVREVIVAPHGSVGKNEMMAHLVKLTNGGKFNVLASNSSYNGR